mgnify:CR=1 FL=1
MIKVGLYIPIPFCIIKCIHWDFYSISQRNNQIPSFIETVIKDIERYVIKSKNFIFYTFFGVGTFSTLNALLIENLIYHN